MPKIITIITFCLLCVSAAQAQDYYSTGSAAIPGSGQDVYASINVSGLGQSSIDGSFGLFKVKVDISYPVDEDLVIQLVAPDGTTVSLAENLGGSSPDYTNTTFEMGVPNLIHLEEPPYSLHMRPEGWLGRVNNGQSGDGVWKLHIINTGVVSNTGTLNSWSLHFDANPAPPEIFTESNLPIVVINTDNNVIVPHDKDEKIDAQMGIIYNGQGQTNHTSDAYNHYDGAASIKVRGKSSREYAQKSYNIELRDTDGSDLDTPLLGMSNSEDWVLYAPWNDKSLIRNIITYQMSNEMGRYAPRTRLCELVLNGDYRGVYVLMEKIKRGTDRVNISKLDSNENSGENLTGGYIVQVDRNTFTGIENWESAQSSTDTCPNPIAISYEYPKSEAITNEQKDYIQKYIDSFETALKTISLSDEYNGYRKYIDYSSFIDHSILQEVSGNADAYRLSSFFHKTKMGKLNAGPVWDFNFAFGNCELIDSYTDYGFRWNVPCTWTDEQVPFWWKKLREDALYKSDYNCRYNQLRSTVFRTDHINGMIDSLVTLVQDAQQRHYTRWPVMGIYLYPEWFVGQSYDEEITYLKDWIANRINWLDNNLYHPLCANTVAQVNNRHAAIKLYPNPVQDELHITSSGNINKICVYNVQGQKIMEQDINNSQYTLQVKQYGLRAGVYNICIFTDKDVHREQVVIY